MSREKRLAPVECLGELRFNRMLSDAELLRDLAVGKVFKFTEDEDFTATRGQFRDGCGQEIGLLTPADVFGDTGRLVEDAREIVIRYGKNLCRGAAAQKIARGVARSRKQQSPRRHNGPPLAGSEEAHIGLLDDVIGVDQRSKMRAQVSPQSRFVRLHLAGEPAGVLGVLRRHGKGVDRKTEGS